MGDGFEARAIGFDDIYTFGGDADYSNRHWSRMIVGKTITHVKMRAYLDSILPHFEDDRRIGRVLIESLQRGSSLRKLEESANAMIEVGTK